MALAGRGSFRTVTPTAHTVTNANVIQRFLDVPIHIHPDTAADVHRITIGPER
jgi:RNA 3'-terminal phosphate cyclase